MNAHLTSSPSTVSAPAITPAIAIAHMRPEHIEPLAHLQPIVFPTLHPDEHLKVEHFLNHLRLFPEGQFVALVDGKVVGSTSTMRLNFDFSNPQHAFMDIIDHGWLSGHNPRGQWLYGADMNIHPDFRRLGLGRKLYEARTALIERLNLRGQVAGGMLPGYVHHAHRMSPLEYCQKVVAGEMVDPTLTPQLKNGFRFVEVLYDYFVSPSDAYKAAALIVKDNLRYRPNNRFDRPAA